MRLQPNVLLLATLLLTTSFPARSSTIDESEAGIVPREGLVLARPGGAGGRSLVGRDPVMARIAAGTWSAPKEGEPIAWPDGPTPKWEALHAKQDGLFIHKDLRGGYLYLPLESAKERILLLQGRDYGFVSVNGEPRMGDVYGHGYVRTPIKLNAGSNGLLFQAGRNGSLSVRLDVPAHETYLETADTTLPDLIVDEPAATWGALLVINASQVPLEGLRLRATLAGSAATTAVPALLPLSVRKARFRIEAPAPLAEASKELTVELLGPEDRGPKLLDSAQLKVAVRKPNAKHKRTFVSEIDGSVQYYGVVPALEGNTSRSKPGLILTLHGAGVEGMGQANVYAAKPWAHIVAPTNRRPYGFDWEDWGRLDALEVLAEARRQFDTDLRRTYLTGHSMGGHGTWYLGATFPDLFAAIAPSAGWISMWTYAGARRSQGGLPTSELVERASRTSDTMALAPNLNNFGIYVLHGDRDDNVPVGQARTMRRWLGEFHADFAYFEQPGAGHWWGNPCCDWPPLMEFLARHERPKAEDVRAVHYVTTNPGISSRLDWATVEAQTKPLQPSTVRLTFDPDRRRFAGTTENVARLVLDLAHVKPGGDLEAELDGEKLSGLPKPGEAPRLWLTRNGSSWTRSEEPSRAHKGPHRNGPFKDAFRHRFQLVYGTRGSSEENAWALAKARYDAEAFWYRGNGSIDVLADSAFDPKAEPDRGVVLYGNAQTNAAWEALLAGGPVRIEPGAVRVGEREVRGDNLACLLVRPRPGSDRACVAVVGGTGISGMRITDCLPYFVSGVGLPDLTVLGPEALTAGFEGLRAAGYFGNDWSVEAGEFAWRE
jgi:dienelactone hydrolase